MSYQFSNPIFGGQDPFVCKGDDGYYFVAEAAGSKEIYVYHSDRLTERGERYVVYRAEESGESSADLWAPEIWNFNNKWYIYYAGASLAGEKNWHTHRMFVLEADKPIGPYKEPVKLELGEQMAIDGSVLQLAEDKFIFFYMGRNEEKKLNCLYMALMDSPTHICGEPILLSEPEFDWEERINEGPFPIYRNGKVSLLYSAHAAHLPNYCLALLICKDIEHILEPSSWEKLKEPLLTQEGNVIGPGHGCIVSSPDNTEEWLLYHSKFDHDYTLPGGWNRVANLLRVTWEDDIIPRFEQAHPLGTAVMVPAGEKELSVGKTMQLSLNAKSQKYFSEYTYSRSKTVEADDSCIRIAGSVWPEFGDKLILRENVYENCTIHLSMRNTSEEGEVGGLFRVQLPAAGALRWRGYGVYADKIGNFRLVKCDGKKITVLAQKRVQIDGVMDIFVTLNGASIRVSVNEQELFAVADDTFDQGRIGIGTLGGDGEFMEMNVRRNSYA